MLRVSRCGLRPTAAAVASRVTGIQQQQLHQSQPQQRRLASTTKPPSATKSQASTRATKRTTAHNKVTKEVPVGPYMDDDDPSHLPRGLPPPPASPAARTSEPGQGLDAASFALPAAPTVEAGEQPHQSGTEQMSEQQAELHNIAMVDESSEVAGQIAQRNQHGPAFFSDEYDTDGHRIRPPPKARGQRPFSTLSWLPHYGPVRRFSIEAGSFSSVGSSAPSAHTVVTPVTANTPPEEMGDIAAGIGSARSSVVLNAAGVAPGATAATGTALGGSVAAPHEPQPYAFDKPYAPHRLSQQAVEGVEARSSAQQGQGEQQQQQPSMDRKFESQDASSFRSSTDRESYASGGGSGGGRGRDRGQRDWDSDSDRDSWDRDSWDRSCRSDRGGRSMSRGSGGPGPRFPNPLTFLPGLSQLPQAFAFVESFVPSPASLPLPSPLRSFASALPPPSVVVGAFVPSSGGNKTDRDWSRERNERLQRDNEDDWSSSRRDRSRDDDWDARRDERDREWNQPSRFSDRRGQREERGRSQRDAWDSSSRSERAFEREESRYNERDMRSRSANSNPLSNLPFFNMLPHFDSRPKSRSQQVSQMLRVNHAGEYAVGSVFEGQLAVLDLQHSLKQSLGLDRQRGSKRGWERDRERERDRDRDRDEEEPRGESIIRVDTLAETLEKQQPTYATTSTSSFDSSSASTADLGSSTADRNYDKFDEERDSSERTDEMETRDPRTVIRQTRAQELSHLSTLERLLPEHRTRPSALMPLWYAAGWSLGAASAMLGSKAALATTAAMEQALAKQYNDQLRTLNDPHDVDARDSRDQHQQHEGRSSERNLRRLRDVLKRHRDEEQELRDQALRAGARDLPGFDALTGALQLGCQTASSVAKVI